MHLLLFHRGKTLKVDLFPLGIWVSQENGVVAYFFFVEMAITLVKINTSVQNNDALNIYATLTT